VKKITICIANHKGGVGKTTTAVSLGAGLAALGYPTVIIDCDPQGNVASFLGRDPAPGLFDLLVHRTKATDIVERIGESKLFIIPGDSSTVDVETLLRTSSRYNPATTMREALASFVSNGKPTVIILDTAPSLSSVQIAALSAADWLLIPASPEYASETGIGALASAIADLQQTGAGVQLLGIVPTLVDHRSREHKQTIADLHAAFPGLVLPPVRRLIAIAEAPRAGQTIWDYAPDAAVDYAAVLVEVRRRCGL
jgi:chromosome partitioning protein